MWRDIVFNFRNGRNCIIPTAAECSRGINDALKGQIPLAWWSPKLNDSIEHFQLEQEIIKLENKLALLLFKKCSHRRTTTKHARKTSEN
jgi:hypothetical protein